MVEGMFDEFAKLIGTLPNGVQLLELRASAAPTHFIKLSLELLFPKFQRLALRFKFALLSPRHCSNIGSLSLLILLFDNCFDVGFRSRGFQPLDGLVKIVLVQDGIIALGQKLFRLSFDVLDPRLEALSRAAIQ